MSVSRSRVAAFAFAASSRSSASVHGPSFGRGWTSRSYENAVSPDRRIRRTVLRDRCRVRAISLIDFPLPRCSRRIRPIVSTISIPPPPASRQSRQPTKPEIGGSILDDDDAPQGVNFARRNTLAAERTRKRAELLDATEKALVRIRAMTEKKRNPLRGADRIALKVGAVLDRRHMAKHFDLAIAETGLAWSRKAEAIAAEAALDGLYVIRSSLPA